VDNFVENLPCNLSEWPPRKHRVGKRELLKDEKSIKINGLIGIKWALARF
jgi:hypothetical protein